MRRLLALAGLILAMTAAGPAGAAHAAGPPATAGPPTAAVLAGGTDEGGEGELINVRVRIDETREDVPGVPVTVRQDGEVVGEAETDDGGLASIPVPSPGEYEIELDLSAFEGQDLGVEENPFTTRVDPGTPRTVAFRLVAGAGEGDGGVAAATGFFADIPWQRTPQLVASGLRFGLILALAAIGLSLVFGTTGLTNFAHGELVTFGALVTYAVHVVGGVPLLLAIPIVLVLSAAFGWFQDTAIWRQLRRKQIGLIAMMIFSIGLSFFMRYGFLYLFGGQTVFYRDFTAQGPIEIGSIRIPPAHLIVMGISVVVLIAFALALLYTRIGKATRAVSDNPALAAASGIDVDNVIRVVWIVGTSLAALSGIFFGLTQGMDFQLGFQILLLIFAAVVLGGLGTAFGAMLGAVVVGLLIEVSTLVIPPELKNVGALAVLIIILLVKPSGLLGRRERVG